jgi:hypothetical protein
MLHNTAPQEYGQRPSLRISLNHLFPVGRHTRDAYGVTVAGYGNEGFHGISSNASTSGVVTVVAPLVAEKLTRQTPTGDVLVLV